MAGSQEIFCLVGGRIEQAVAYREAAADTADTGARRAVVGAVDPLDGIA